MCALASSGACSIDGLSFHLLADQSEWEALDESLPRAKAEVWYSLAARSRTTGEVVGGIVASTSYGGLYVLAIGVRSDWRRTRGVGRALLRSVVERVRTATSATERPGVLHLTTFDFQGFEYYPKLGFHQDAVLAGWAHGMSAAFFSLPLGIDEAGDAERLLQPQHSPASDATLPDFTIEPVEMSALNTFLTEVFVSHAQETLGLDEQDFVFAFEARVPAGVAAAQHTGGEQPTVRVATVTASSFWGGVMVRCVAVDEPYRGRGIGSRLVQLALEYARSRGCSVATVDLLSTEAREQDSFWRRLGFREFGRTPGFVDGAEMVHLSLHMTPGTESHTTAQQNNS